MKKFIKLLSSAMVISSFVMPVAFHASAQGMNALTLSPEHQQAHPHGKQPRDKIKRLARKLDLNEQQQQKITAIFAEQKDVLFARRETMVDFKNQIENLITAAVFDDAAFMALHQQYQTQFVEAALQRAKTKHAVMQVLTPSQQEKFKEMNLHRKGRLH